MNYSRIRSSWNIDRVAGSILNKDYNPRKIKSVSKAKIYRTSDLYTELYGREAYEAWKAREVEIDEMMKDRVRYSVKEIASLREQNFLAMKSAGENRERCVTAEELFNPKFEAAA